MDKTDSKFEYDMRMRCAVRSCAGIIYGTQYDGKFIVKMNPDDGSSDFLKGIDSNCLSGVFGTCDENSIYIPSFFGEVTMRYSIAENKVEFLPLGMEKISDVMSALSFVTVFEDKLYIFATFSNEVYITDLLRGSVSSAPICIKKEKGEPGEIYSSNGIRQGNRVFLFSPFYNGIICFDLTQMKSELYRSDSFFRFKCGVKNRNDFYFLSDEEGIYKGKVSGGNIQTELLIPKEKYCEGGSLGKIDTNIWLLPGHGSTIKIYNFDTREIKNYTNIPDDHKYLLYTDDYLKYELYFETEEKYYFWNFVQTHYLEIDKRSGSCRWVKPVMNDSKENIHCFLEGLNPLQERDVGLEGFISLITKV